MRSLTLSLRMSRVSILASCKSLRTNSESFMISPPKQPDGEDSGEQVSPSGDENALDGGAAKVFAPFFVGHDGVTFLEFFVNRHISGLL